MHHTWDVAQLSTSSSGISALLLPLDSERVTADMRHVGWAVHLRCEALHHLLGSKLAHSSAIVMQEAQALQDPRVLGALHAKCLQVC